VGFLLNGKESLSTDFEKNEKGFSVFIFFWFGEKLSCLFSVGGHKSVVLCHNPTKAAL
jgi:hypothetical protein